MTSFRVAGDDSNIAFVPVDRQKLSFKRLPAKELKALREVSDLSSTVSDVLDDLGYNLTVPAEVLSCRLPSAPPVVGQALTLVYMPERMQSANPEVRRSQPKMAHNFVFSQAEPGDVLVLDAHGIPGVSTMGANAALAAKSAGLAAAIVDGCIRDVHSVIATGFPIWSRGVSSRTGKYRIEATSFNRPAYCGGVQVLPGDVVVADETGTCFVPVDLFGDLMSRIVNR